MRRVRNAFASPDSVTASAMSAREDIGRAISAKIKDAHSPAELAALEDVLPELEKFLESPEEKRLRRLRTGTIIAAVGFGTAIGLILAALAMGEEGLVFLAGLGVITFFIGIAFLLNGTFLTVPRRKERKAAADVGEPPLLTGAFARALTTLTPRPPHRRCSGRLPRARLGI